MQEYCAFLGHQPSISLAELTVLLPDMRVTKLWSRQIVTFDLPDCSVVREGTAQELGADWLSLVGGTVLIAKRLKRSTLASSPSPSQSPSPSPPPFPPLESVIPSLLHEELKNVKRKAVFSFRCIGVPRNVLRSLYRSCKKHLRDKGMPSRYIGNERNPAKPGTLLLRGIPGPMSCELVVLRDEETGECWVGKTVAAQDIEAYTDRDMGKPFRDTRTGLMPPKLAQVMLNLALLTMNNEKRKTIERAGDWRGVTIWDPFCGSGVVAMEALRRRAHVLASDRTERAVKGCGRNIRWLRERAKIPKTATHAVWKENALKVSETARPPDAVVTETSLGPALASAPVKRELPSLIRGAETLEAAFFANMAERFPAVPVVCAFPVYVTRDGEKHFLPKIISTIEALGYRRTCVNNPFVSLTARHTLLYLRPNQNVGREIACFLPPCHAQLRPQARR